MKYNTQLRSSASNNIKGRSVHVISSNQDFSQSNLIWNCILSMSVKLCTWLHVLPEVDIGVIKDIGVQIEVVEALWREHHTHVVTAVKER